MTIKVSLDTTKTPPEVTVKPENYNVNNGNETINWVPDAHQTFTFSGLTIADPPFGVPTITPSEISVTDVYSVPGEFSYTIFVSYNGNTYSSGLVSSTGRGGNALSAMQSPHVVGSGNPTIRNN